jgi:hypothetical protein
MIVEASKPGPRTPWVPTPTEVAEIVEEMRPIIAAFAEQYRREQRAPQAPPHAA